MSNPSNEVPDISPITLYFLAFKDSIFTQAVIMPLGLYFYFRHLILMITVLICRVADAGTKLQSAYSSSKFSSTPLV